MADILDLNAEEEFEGGEGDREVRMKDLDEEEESTVLKLKEKARKRKGRGFGGGRRGDSDVEGDYDRLVKALTKLPSLIIKSTSQAQDFLLSPSL